MSHVCDTDMTLSKKTQTRSSRRIRLAHMCPAGLDVSPLQGLTQALNDAFLFHDQSPFRNFHDLFVYALCHNIRVLKE